MPTINLTDDELAAATAAIRRAIETDKFPAPRAWTRSAPRSQSSIPPRRRSQPLSDSRDRARRRQSEATSGRGDNRATGPPPR